MSTFDADLCSRYLADLLHALNTRRQHEEVLHLIVDRTFRLTHCQTCAIALIDPKTEYLQIDNYHGLSLRFCNAFRRRIAAQAIGQLLWTGVPIILTGHEADRSLAEEIQLEHPFVSCVCVQIAVHERTLGYLHVDSTQEDAFSQGILHFLRMCADIAGTAILKSRLLDENLRLERVDGETGLEKYQPFTEKLDAALLRGDQIGEQSSILLLDVDNFKDIVNTYGYDASRQVLKELGGRIKAALRPIDSACRYGFDEIAVLIENTDLKSALRFAEGLRHAIADHPFTPRGIPSTASMGVATSVVHGSTSTDLINSAKRALFEAQRAGRNNVYTLQGAHIEEGVHAL
jgi:diguanylate cyclase (GGDEF)-like protein